MPVALSTGHDWGIGGCLGRISTGQEVQRSMQHVEICLEVRWLMMFPFRKLNVTFRFVWRYAGYSGFWACFWAEDFRQELQKWDPIWGDSSNSPGRCLHCWQSSHRLTGFPMGFLSSAGGGSLNFLLVHRVWNWFHCKSKPHVIHCTIIKLMASG